MSVNAAYLAVVKDKLCKEFSQLPEAYIDSHIDELWELIAERDESTAPVTDAIVAAIESDNQVAVTAPVGEQAEMLKISGDLLTSVRNGEIRDLCLMLNHMDGTMELISQSQSSIFMWLGFLQYSITTGDGLDDDEDDIDQE